MSDKKEITKEEKIVLTKEEIVDSMVDHLTNTFENTTFNFHFIKDSKYIIAEITSVRTGAFEDLKNLFDEKYKDIDETQTIIFRQIVDDTFTEEKNNERVQKSYERNLRVYDKLAEDHLTKHGQLIKVLNQAEIVSIKTVKLISKEE